MYRYLEEDRNNKTGAEEIRAAGTCTCTCKTPTEQGQEKAPGGDQLGLYNGDYYEKNG